MEHVGKMDSSVLDASAWIHRRLLILRVHLEYKDLRVDCKLMDIDRCRRPSVS
jgi:hypothetical protein